MEKCLRCGKLTDGSIGAAGLVWKAICQPCKDEEDYKLKQVYTNLSELEKIIFNSVLFDERTGRKVEPLD